MRFFRSLIGIFMRRIRGTKGKNCSRKEGKEGCIHDRFDSGVRKSGFPVRNPTLRFVRAKRSSRSRRNREREKDRQTDGERQIDRRRKRERESRSGRVITRVVRRSLAWPATALISYLSLIGLYSACRVTLYVQRI